MFRFTKKVFTGLSINVVNAPNHLKRVPLNN